MTKKEKSQFFEDNTGRVENGTKVLHFDYIFTHNQQDDIEFTSTGLKFQNN
jgi:hypothetical protein